MRERIFIQHWPTDIYLVRFSLYERSVSSIATYYTAGRYAYPHVAGSGLLPRQDKKTLVIPYVWIQSLQLLRSVDHLHNGPKIASSREFSTNLFFHLTYAIQAFLLPWYNPGHVNL